MGRKVKYSSKEKINAVKEYLDGKDSINSIAKRLDITFQAFKQWVNNYEAMGADAFMTCHNKHYSKAEKEQAIAAYLAGEVHIWTSAKSIKFIQLLNSEDGLRSIMVMRSLKFPEQED